ncbi:hypothetical protein AL542_16920 [Grimontia hollisae]|uniref:HupE-UreJ family metal transporter n=2 Tax=Grimontia hollisae TaxID=673 RepID=D0IAG6_GRIHO|nr:HupE/UreJ family protein [Grimontia hollisae]AMG31856.1 hypothetical protein AL542_16920 [Grimontia hollisae]EEY70884.1 HupE-UreJ family metal transporter [Grimontia hollisae CIP 101886]MDF2186291.1 HupE/UreJ family protein [Grimontia hollisae]STO44610.1 HupE / UreJ protein [Grimontia hollisae]STO57473.1 HupE / UreJ protein [Grimontia hollisae]
MKRNGYLLATVLASAAPFTAVAHTGHEVNGFLAGISHPITGADHAIALIAIGIWAFMLKNIGVKNAGSLIPSVFLATMAFGAALTFFGVNVPLVETGIALSVLLLGFLLVVGRSLPLIATLPLTALFALAHGAAHGAEMPYAVSTIGYFSGFLISSAALIFVGVTLAKTAERFQSTRFVMPISGGLIVFSGVYQLIMS